MPHVGILRHDLEVICSSRLEVKVDVELEICVITSYRGDLDLLGIKLRSAPVLDSKDDLSPVARTVREMYLDIAYVALVRDKALYERRTVDIAVTLESRSDAVRNVCIAVKPGIQKYKRTAENRRIRPSLYCLQKRTGIQRYIFRAFLYLRPSRYFKCF